MFNIQKAGLYVGIPLLFLSILATQLAVFADYAVFFDNVHWTIGYFLAALFAWLGVSKGNRAHRLFKRSIAWGLTSLAIGQFMWDVQVAIHWNPYPAPSDMFFLMLGISCIWGFWRMFRESLAPAQTRAVPFDLLIVSISLIAFTLVLYLPLSSSMNWLQLFVTLAYPVFLMTAAAMALLLILRLAPKPGWGWVLMLVGLLIQGYAWLQWNLLALGNNLGVGTLLNISFSISAVMIGLGTMIWNMESSRNEFYKKICEKILLSSPVIAGILITLALLLVINSPHIMPVLRNLVAVATVLILVVIVVRQTSLLSDSELLLNAEKKIHNLAYYDPLTQLPNRRQVTEKLEQAIFSAKRHQTYGAVFCIDVDNFKNLNDSKGHEMGDALLIAISGRMKAHLAEGDMVARSGGDEFVVVLTNLSDEHSQAALHAESIAERLVRVIRSPFQIVNTEHHSSISIGITLFGADSESSDEILKRADNAMYQAKSAGKNTWKFFDPEMEKMLENRLFVESWMRTSFPDNYELFYQLQINNEGIVHGAEALLRLRHPEKGYISPIEFIPLAEETGLIFPLGKWVLETACNQLKLWESHPVMKNLQLAVNLSPRQFRERHFVEQVAEIIRRFEINPLLLKLEITETLVMDAIDETIVKMRQLRELGVKFSIDDFGTGQSSLSYLTRLPLDQLKIDKSFVSNIFAKQSDAIIVQTVIVMANSLGLDVIAEGVETSEQREFLIKSGCNNFQGFLFSKPLPLNEFEKLFGG